MAERFTLTCLRRAERALRAYERGRITASRLCECITAAMQGSWYDLGDAESTPERIFAYVVHHGPTSAIDLARALDEKMDTIQVALTRAQRRHLLVRPSQRGGTWSVAGKKGG